MVGSAFFCSVEGSDGCKIVGTTIVGLSSVVGLIGSEIVGAPIVCGVDGNLFLRHIFLVTSIVTSLNHLYVHIFVVMLQETFQIELKNK